MLEKMKNIIFKNDLCVLATASEGVPHCSLMSYVPDEEGKEIYFVSHKATRKYLNLVKNPSVSLLIDTREEQAGQERIKIKSLTINGEFQAVNESGKKDYIRSRFLKQHPHLNDFLNDPGSDIFSIRLKSLQLLDGVKDISIETLEK